MRAWYEFNWLRVETGGQRLGLMKSHCIKTWWNPIGNSDWGGGDGGGVCRCVSYVATHVFDFLSPDALELRFRRVRRALLTLSLGEQLRSHWSVFVKFFIKGIFTTHSTNLRLAKTDKIITLKTCVHVFC